MIEQLKAVGLGMMIGAIIGGTLIYRLKPYKAIYILPSEIRGGRIVSYEMPKDMAGVLKLAIFKNGKFDMEWYKNN
ncbi:MAG: hypothetical protein ACFFG0_05520 [Candidatus Thorarchaeota archaeon]